MDRGQSMRSQRVRKNLATKCARAHPHTHKAHAVYSMFSNELVNEYQIIPLFFFFFFYNHKVSVFIR